MSAVSVTTGLWGLTRVPSILGCPKGFSPVWVFLLWTHCMETRAAIPCKGCFQCLPWANSLGLNWSLFSASKYFLILQLQHSPVSSSNTYLNQTISHLFLLPSVVSASAVWLFQCSSMPSLSGITGGHSSKSISETPGRLKEKWKADQEPCDSHRSADFNCYSYWFTPFLLLMERSREERATSCHIFGAVADILRCPVYSRVRAAAQRLSRALCAAAIGTFCSDVQPSPCQTNSICWNVFPEAVSAMCMCSFSCCSAIQSVCGWSLRSAVPPLLVSVSAGSWCVHNF